MLAATADRARTVPATHVPRPTSEAGGSARQAQGAANRPLAHPTTSAVTPRPTSAAVATATTSSSTTTATAVTPKAPVAGCLAASRASAGPPRTPIASAVSASPSRCSAPVIRIRLVTARAAGRRAALPPTAADANTSTVEPTPPRARPTIGAHAIAAPTSAGSGLAAAVMGSRVSTDTDSRSPPNMSVVAVADAGIVERRHFGQRRDRHLQHRQRDESPGAPAQPQPQINHRGEPEGIQRGALRRLAGAMSGDPPVDGCGCDA